MLRPSVFMPASRKTFPVRSLICHSIVVRSGSARLTSRHSRVISSRTSANVWTRSIGT